MDVVVPPAMHVPVSPDTHVDHLVDLTTRRTVCGLPGSWYFTGPLSTVTCAACKSHDGFTVAVATVAARVRRWLDADPPAPAMIVAILETIPATHQPADLQTELEGARILASLAGDQ